MKLLKFIYLFIISLKVAIGNLIILTICLTVGTILESTWGFEDAQHWIYQSLLFYSLLGFLFLQIFSVAMSRWPWKPKHLPFLSAHLGILLTLLGSWITAIWGLNGMLRLRLQVENKMVETQELGLMAKSTRQNTNPIFVPIHGLAKDRIWKPMSVTKNNLPGFQISNAMISGKKALTYLPDDYLSTKRYFAQNKDQAAFQFQVTWKPNPRADNSKTETTWIWEDDSATHITYFQDFRIFYGSINEKSVLGPWLSFEKNENGFQVKLKGKNNIKSPVSNEQLTSRKFLEGGKIFSVPADSGLYEISLIKVIPKAKRIVEYLPTGPREIGGPALKIRYDGKVAGHWNTDHWITYGEWIEPPGSEMSFYFSRTKFELPFSIQLNQFDTKLNPGTMNPADFRSDISITHSDRSKSQMLVQMNAPVTIGSFTFYQSSFEGPIIRPTASVLAVSYDPGRYFKYSGALLVVIGILGLFTFRKKIYGENYA